MEIQEQENMEIKPTIKQKNMEHGDQTDDQTEKHGDWLGQSFYLSKMMILTRYAVRVNGIREPRHESLQR